MRNISITLMWLLLGAVTFFVALVHTGCGSATKPTAAKPEPRQTEAIPMVCLQVFRKEQTPVVICGSQRMCDHVHGRLETYWGALSARYDLEALSDCTPLDAQFTER